ncbi:MAG TPA: hypothetical protein DIS68_05205, partial [Lachnospiraceae bacterium]|nr:hypothetical protein [Lachnospiraceae bacterium]
MEEKISRAYADTGKTADSGKSLNWIPVGIMMVFYAGTWISPRFYHVTERYNSLIIFGALALLFFINVDWIGRLREKDMLLFALIVSLAIATANLFIIGSNKGCILILADFLLLLYMTPHISFTTLQYRTLVIFFFIMYA